MLVPLKTTPLPMSEVRAALRVAFRQYFGNELPAVAEPYLLAIIALENAHGEAIQNNNFGNITLTASSAAPYWQAPGNDRRFAAFSSPEEGLKEWLRLLTRETHLRILDAAFADDFAGFFDGLTKPHPQTKMAYCPDCKTSAARKTYAALVDQFRTVPRSSGKSPTAKKRREVNPLFFLVPLGALVYVLHSRKDYPRGL